MTESNYLLSAYNMDVVYFDALITYEGCLLQNFYAFARKTSPKHYIIAHYV